MNYERNVVLMTYRAANESKRDPTAAQLNKFDQDMHNFFQAEIDVQAAAAGIPMDDFSKSMLMFFARQSEAVTAKTQVKHAVQYYQNTKPVPPTPPPVV